MMKTTLLRTNTFLLISCLASPIALAGGAAPFYIGGSAGISSTNSEVEDFDIYQDCKNQHKDSYCDLDDKSNAFSVYGGMRLSDSLAVEAGYVNLGDTVSFDNNGLLIANQQTTGMVVNGLVRQRLSKTAPILAYGKAGVVRWDSKLDLESTSQGHLGSVEQDGFSGTVGAGLEYEMSHNLTLRAGWDRYFGVGEADAIIAVDKNTGDFEINTHKADVDVWSAGLNYDFL